MTMTTQTGHVAEDPIAKALHEHHPEVKAQAAKAQAVKLESQHEDMRWLMGHAQGRRVVWRMLEQAGIYRDSFTGNSTTFYNEGRRAMGLFVLEQVMAACPEKFAVMMNEQNRKSKNAE